MKFTLVLTDSFQECRKALETFNEFAEAFSADKDILVVMEDLYRLESASVSLGVPLPPDTVPTAKKKMEDKVLSLWRKVKGEEDATVDISIVAGDLREEVDKFLQEKPCDMIIWGCNTSAQLCKIVENLNVKSLIIK